MHYIIGRFVNMCGDAGAKVRIMIARSIALRGR